MFSTITRNKIGSLRRTSARIQYIIYHNKTTTAELMQEINDSEKEEETIDEDKESGGLIVLDALEQQNSDELCNDTNDIVIKIRGIVKLFKRSPQKVF